MCTQPEAVSSPTHLTVEQLSPAALGLGWLTKRKKKKERIMRKGREKRVHYLITLFVQEEVNY